MAETYKGWIKCYRQIKESAVWSDPLRLKAWIDILFSANIEDKDWFAYGTLIHIKRGQFVTSNRNLQKSWGCSQRTVTRILNQFSEMDMIKVESPHKKYTLITVIKYEVFQDKRNSEDYSEGYSEGYTEGDSEDYKEGQQLKNNKNNKNDKEKKEAAAPALPRKGRVILEE